MKNPKVFSRFLQIPAICTLVLMLFISTQPALASTDDNNVSLQESASFQVNSSGASWLSFLGGSADEELYGIAVDDSGNVYVTGICHATWGSPVRAFTSGYPSDAFAAKLNSSGVLQWNTFLGSSGNDWATEIVADGSGNVYITGMSNAAWGAPVMPYTAWNDAFVSRLNSNGSIE
jgi:hypothetical protein